MTLHMLRRRPVEMTLKGKGWRDDRKTAIISYCKRYFGLFLSQQINLWLDRNDLVSINIVSNDLQITNSICKRRAYFQGYFSNSTPALSQILLLIWLIKKYSDSDNWYQGSTIIHIKNTIPRSRCGWKTWKSRLSLISQIIICLSYHMAHIFEFCFLGFQWTKFDFNKKHAHAGQKNVQGNIYYYFNNNNN